jgi:hypothetical protein
MVSSLSQIARKFVTDSRTQLKELSMKYPVSKWNFLPYKKPRTDGWYAIYKDDFAPDEHSAAYWTEGDFWTYWTHGPLRTRRRVDDVVKWRPLTLEERKTWQIAQDAVFAFHK